MHSFYENIEYLGNAEPNSKSISEFYIAYHRNCNTSALLNFIVVYLMSHKPRGLSDFAHDLPYARYYTVHKETVLHLIVVNIPY